jgi:hypothetical protein
VERSARPLHIQGGHASEMKLRNALISVPKK